MLDVRQDPSVDAVNEQVRPERPVGLRKHLKGIPGSTFESRARGGQWSQQELATGAPQMVVQVGRTNVPIRAQFKHRIRLLGNVECKSPCFFPMRDRLDEDPSCEFAVARGSRSVADNPRALGTGNPQAKVPISGFRQIGELDDIFPDDRRRRVDLHTGAYDAFFGIYKQRLAAGENR